MKQEFDTPLSISLSKVMKESQYLPGCKYNSTHKILFNFKGNNPKASYCAECDKWFMIVEVSEKTLKECC